MEHLYVYIGKKEVTFTDVGCDWLGGTTSDTVRKFRRSTVLKVERAWHPNLVAVGRVWNLIDRHCNSLSTSLHMPFWNQRTSVIQAVVFNPTTAEFETLLSLNSNQHSTKTSSSKQKPITILPRHHASQNQRYSHNRDETPSIPSTGRRNHR